MLFLRMTICTRDVYELLWETIWSAMGKFQIPHHNIICMTSWGYFLARWDWKLPSHFGTGNIRYHVENGSFIRPKMTCISLFLAQILPICYMLDTNIIMDMCVISHHSSLMCNVFDYYSVNFLPNVFVINIIQIPQLCPRNITCDLSI
jgi:hypothetical protein